jgi:hypothetical protein
MLAAPGAIYHRRAGRGVATPFVVFDKQTGLPSWTLGARDLNDELWMVKAVDRAPSATRAEEIAAQIDTVLRDAPLMIAPYTVVWCRRDSDIDFLEEDQAEAVQHCGGLYRLLTERVL